MTLRNEVKFRTDTFWYCWGLLILTRLTVGLSAAPLLGVLVGAALWSLGTSRSRKGCTANSRRK